MIAHPGTAPDSSLAIFPATASAAAPRTPDAALFARFDHDPHGAWQRFLERYADTICATLRGLGFDYDQVMDRFVYVCEKLAENDYRRLRSVRYFGDRGEVTPWLRQVVKRLAINWAQSREGRRRLLKPIARLAELDQRIFEIYFWQGRTPSEVCERLRNEHDPSVELLDVFAGLERIFRCLSAKKLWRLVSGLTGRRKPLSLTYEEGDGERPVPCLAADPEEALLRRERRRHLETALAELEPYQRRLIELRYRDGLGIPEAARALDLGEREARAALRAARRRLRRSAERLPLAA